MRILNEKQLDSVIESLLPLQRELLPRGADLLALIAELEGGKPQERGYAGVARCIGEPAAQAVRETLESLVYAFPVLKFYLMQPEKPADGSQAQPQLAAMLLAINTAAESAMREFEKLLSTNALDPEQVAVIRKEIDELAHPPAQGALPRAGAAINPNQAMEAALKAEKEALAELEQLLKAAKIDPKQIMPEMEKLHKPGPDMPPNQQEGAPKAPEPSPKPQGAKSEQEILSELDKAEQQARANVHEIEKQLVDAGVERSAIDELLALLKSPG